MNAKGLPPLLALLSPLLLNSCVSSFMVMTGKKVVIAKSRSEAEAAYGKPVKTGKLAKKDPVQKDLSWVGPPDWVRHTGGITNYEIYQHKGLMQDKDWGGSAAMANAVTLGTSEVVSIPSAIFNRVSNAATTHYFFAGYVGPDRMVIFKKIGDSYRDRSLKVDLLQR